MGTLGPSVSADWICTSRFDEISQDTTGLLGLSVVGCLCSFLNAHRRFMRHDWVPRKSRAEFFKWMHLSQSEVVQSLESPESRYCLPMSSSPEENVGLHDFEMAQNNHRVTMDGRLVPAQCPPVSRTASAGPCFAAKLVCATRASKKASRDEIWRTGGNQGGTSILHGANSGDACGHRPGRPEIQRNKLSIGCWEQAHTLICRIFCVPEPFR